MKDFGEVLDKVPPGHIIVKIGEGSVLFRETDRFVPVFEATGAETGDNPMTLQQLADQYANGDLKKLRAMPVTIEVISVQTGE